MTVGDHPLRLDVPREEVLAQAVSIVTDAWASFDRFRPEEPPIGEGLRALLRTSLPESPTPVRQVLQDAVSVLDASVAQPRPRFLAFIGSSGLEVGVVGDLLAHTYDVNLAVDARAATEIEWQAVRWAAQFVGYPGRCAGVFTSGGTVSNVSALAAAREHALPGSRHAGLGKRRAAVYCSQEAHYSVIRAVELLGMGSANLRTIPIGSDRGLVVEALAEAIDRDRAAGVVPVAVVATAGTTLTGAVDPMEAIAQVCAERDVWMHVDGAYGLPAAAVRPDRFRGVERADSVSVDAHKWLYLPKACGVLLVRHPGHLAGAFAHEQGYLPHQQEQLHAVDLTFEYSRPFRALKFWLAMRAHGARAFRRAIERNLGQARLLYETLVERPDFEVLGPPPLSIVPFRHVPPGVEDPDLHNRRLADALRADGRVWIAPALIDGKVWLRPCFVNFRTTEEDVTDLVAIAAEIGERILG